MANPLPTPETKLCTKCKVLLPSSAFSRRVIALGKLAHWCKSCIKAKISALRDARQLKGLCRCGGSPTRGRKQCDKCLAAQRVTGIRRKADVIAAYGGKCQCSGCEVTEPKFLTIDHIFDDGAEERRRLFRESRTALKKIGSGHSFYCYLKRRGYPKDRYQLLCMNCNFAKGQGGCPHTERESTCL